MHICLCLQIRLGFICIYSQTTNSNFLQVGTKSLKAQMNTGSTWLTTSCPVSGQNVHSERVAKAKACFIIARKYK